MSEERPGPAQCISGPPAGPERLSAANDNEVSAWRSLFDVTAALIGREGLVPPRPRVRFCR